MSYILDALRKSEQERLRGQPLSTLSHSPSGHTDSARPPWLLPLLVGNLMVFTMLGVWWLRSVASNPDGDAHAPAAAGQAVTAEFTPSHAGANATPVPVAAPVDRTADAQQMRDMQPIDRQSTAEGETAERETAEGEYVALPGTPGAVQASEPPLSNADYEAAGDWRSAAGDLPRLAITSHVYSSDHSARNIIINGTRLREGDQLDNGVRVVEITPTGARVAYKGAEQELEIGR